MCQDNGIKQQFDHDCVIINKSDCHIEITSAVRLHNIAVKLSRIIRN